MLETFHAKWKAILTAMRNPRQTVDFTRSLYCKKLCFIGVN